MCSDVVGFKLYFYSAISYVTKRMEVASLLALRSLLEGEGVLLVHGRDNGDHEVLALLELSVDLLTELALRELDVVLRGTVVRHEVKVAVINVDELVLAASHVGHVHVVRRGRNVFVLAVGEDVNSHKVHLGVTVLTGLRGRHVDNLARTALDDYVAVLAQGRALLGVRNRGTGVGGLEVDVLALVVGLVRYTSNVPLWSSVSLVQLHAKIKNCKTHSKLQTCRQCRPDSAESPHDLFPREYPQNVTPPIVP